MWSLLLLLSACHPDKDGADTHADDTGVPPDPYVVPVGPYSAEVRWTSRGVPHIVAADHGSLGFGMGYAFARDHACVLADQVVRVRGERSRYFGSGPDGLYEDEDFGWLALGVREQAEEGWFTLPEDVQAALVGYAAGYNRWVEDHPDHLAGGCEGEEWVQPLTHIDLLTYYLALALQGSGAIFVDMVGNAQPPATAVGRSPAQLALPKPPPPLARFTEARHPPIGSNGWALGRDRVTGGPAALVSNTHFPSEGQLQWHESHLTIPGELDVYGASLMGVPVINVGFNEHVAWTHTVSYTPRFTTALLSLNPDDPLQYEYDGAWETMEEKTYGIQVKNDGGTLDQKRRTLYTSRWGPVINAPGLGWSSIYAVSLMDANRNNLEVAATWLGFARATNLDDLEQVHREHGGVPWVHMMAADDSGEVLYCDPASTPDWSAEAEARYPAWLDESPVAALFDGYGAITIDGRDPVFNWVIDERSPRPGLVPFDEAPQLRRTDFVVNANDDYWLANPAGPITGVPWLYGVPEQPRSARTRMNLTMAGGLDGIDPAGEDARYDLDELEAAVLSGRGKIGELVRDAVVERCTGAPPVLLTGGPGAGETVDLQEACAVLAAWGGTVRLDDPGAALWREFIGSGVFGWEDTIDAGKLFAEPFDPLDPVATPRGLAPAPQSGDDPVLQALGRAAWQLRDAGFELGVTYRDSQFQRKGADFPVPGGTYWEGVIEIASYDGTANETLLPAAPRAAELNAVTGLTTDGYQMNDGNSWVMVMRFTEAGPEARALLTYSQSEDPDSPHYTDQTALYADERLQPVLFREADILADPELEVVDLERGAD